jgi:predicted nucleotidyltransferase
MTPATVLAQRRAEMLRLAAKYGAHHVRIFGSVARGDATADSDVDFLVDLDADRSLLDLGGLQFELQGPAALPGRRGDGARPESPHAGPRAARSRAGVRGPAERPLPSLL